MSDISVMKNPILSCAAGRLCLCPLYRMQGYVSSIGQHACRPMVATTQISAFGCQRPCYALHCCTNGQGISDPESVVLISFFILGSYLYYYGWYSILATFKYSLRTKTRSISICLICSKKGLLHFLLVAQRKEFSEDLLLWTGGGFYGHASVCSIWRWATGDVWLWTTPL